MAVKRRDVLKAGAGLAALGVMHATADEAPPEFRMVPIGRVEARKGQPARIVVDAVYADALLGLDQWSHVNVFYWFDKNDVPHKRRILQVHPRGNTANPLTGVFACRSPVRPNLIALTVCRIVAVEKSVVTLDKIDAFDGTPVLDLKPVIPSDVARDALRVPAWASGRQGPQS